ncbi:MAG: 1-acyl-sn-glycerol-3-phosphate acyltransferase [Candidatus Gastranaerophilales bacterium]|nr:1-acyl-sn-glycerol-3-phosphate acyltransferase [Candidatus Gastranaerophilales bacterium]
MLNFFRKFLYCFILKPIFYICLGYNIKNPNNLPKKGPCIIISNHNSHLDTLVLMTLFSGDSLLKVSPIAAKDYFLKNKLLSFISLKILNIIPLSRHVTKTSQEEFNAMLDWRLKNNSICILYPEGTRGEPEKIAKFKTGIAHIAKTYPNIPIVPIYMEGLGMALPRGEALFIPAICSIVVEEAIKYSDSKDEFMQKIKDIYDKMRNELKKEEI